MNKASSRCSNQEHNISAGQLLYGETDGTGHGGEPVVTRPFSDSLEIGKRISDSTKASYGGDTGGGEYGKSDDDPGAMSVNKTGDRGA